MNVKKVKKDFAIILLVLISVLIAIGFLLIMSIMKSVSYQQLQTAGKSIVVQTTDSFEFAITQIWEHINTTVVYDNELVLLAQERYKNSVSARALLLYPEKYWKQCNFYYNGKKSWMSVKNYDKLLRLQAQEQDRRQFLETIKGVLF